MMLPINTELYFLTKRDGSQRIGGIVLFKVRNIPLATVPVEEICTTHGELALRREERLLGVIGFYQDRERLVQPIYD